jgi:hypothetical protein
LAFTRHVLAYLVCVAVECAAESLVVFVLGLVDYEGASANVNFRLFKGNADKLRDQENYAIVMLRMALKLQQQIDDGDTEKTSEE